MERARFRFHGALTDLLPSHQQANWLDYDFRGAPSLKHAIETFGVPHPEVGFPADLRRPVRDGEDIDVLPRCFTPPGGGEWRFLLDCHLGRLAKYLRILGFDTLYERSAPDDWLARTSAEQNRMLLTMDRGLLMRSLVQHGSFVRSPAPHAQLIEVVARFGLHHSIHPLRRCLRCNAPLGRVPKQEVVHLIPPKTRLWCSAFLQCTGCGHLYWPGSHHDRMLEFVARLRRQVELEPPSPLSPD